MKIRVEAPVTIPVNPRDIRGVHLGVEGRRLVMFAGGFLDVSVPKEGEKR